MPTWEDVQQHLRQRFQLARDEATWAGLVWRFPHGDGFVEQRVTVLPSTASGHTWIVVTAEVCPEAQLEHRNALLHNAELAAGALCLREGLYAMRAVVALDTFASADLDRAIELCAHEAARLRTVLPRPTAPPTTAS